MALPMPPQGAPAPAAAPDAAPAQGGGGGASKLVADIHSGMMKLLDMVQAKFPEEGKELQGIVQQYQDFIDGLGSGEDAGKPEAGPGMVPVEAGAAKVKPAM